MARIATQGVNVHFLRDLSRNRQHLSSLVDIYSPHGTRWRAAVSSRCFQKLRKRDQGIICTSCYIYRLARKRERKRRISTVYTYAYMYTGRTERARLFAQPRKQYIDVQQPINGSLKEGFYRKALGASSTFLPASRTNTRVPGHPHIVCARVRLTVPYRPSTALLWRKVNAFIEPAAARRVDVTSRLTI